MSLHVSPVTKASPAAACDMALLLELPLTNLSPMFGWAARVSAKQGKDDFFEIISWWSQKFQPRHNPRFEAGDETTPTQHCLVTVSCKLLL